MKNLKSLASLILMVIMVVTITACSTASGDEGVIQNDPDKPIVVEDPDLDEIRIGGTPGSAGYIWDEQRNGWHRPWDPDSFLPAGEVPGWIEHIPDNETLEGTIWILESIGGNAVVEGSKVTLEFTKADTGFSVNGSAGCNSYFGSAEFDGKTLSFGPMGCTEMWCMVEDVMDQEFEFIKALGTATGYQVTGNILEITSDSGTLIFDAE